MLATQGRRLALALVCALAIGAVGPMLPRFWVQPATAGAKAARTLIELEMPAEAVRRMRSLPPYVVDWEQGAGGEAVPDTVRTALQKAVDQAFAVESVADAMRGPLEKVGGELAVPEAAAQRFLAAGHEIDVRLAGDVVSSARDLGLRLQGRSDRARITELSELMARAPIAGEVALTASRIARAIDLPRRAGPDGLDAEGAKAISAEIPAFVASSRAEPADDLGPFGREEAERRAKAQIEAQLALLSEEDVAALHDFYASAPGRELRQAMVQAFAAQNDRNAEAMLRAFVGSLGQAGSVNP